MRVQVNGEWRVLPSDLSEITLGQRIAFQAEHGDLLNQMALSIGEMEDELDREIELAQLVLERAFRTVAFFLGTTVEALKESEFVDEVLRLYLATMQQVFDSEQQEELTPRYSFAWNQEEWELSVPELKNGSRMTFGEFIDSKQVIQDMVGLGKNRWECLLPLCAIYLRRVGEDYQESFLYEGSERLELMRSLPLDIALQVGFFLSSSLNMFTQISPFFASPPLSQGESSASSTLSSLAGSTS